MENNGSKKTKRKGTKGNTLAFSITSLEQVARDESLAEGECSPLDTPCHIHIHSKRKRLADADGVSGKAAIDSLVHAGLLEDDGPKIVTGVSYSQEKSSEEETIIYLIEDKNE